MTDEDLWNDERPVSTHGIEVPPWIEQDISASDAMAVCHGGCASGAYMPAAEHHKAAATMAEHGDAVMQYLQDTAGELPAVPADVSWAGLAVHYLSAAVELWCCTVVDQLTEEE